ncbi:AAA family ATPase [Ceratobasidium sp. AG-Ba]|nr:AAA family ATPase [Ceratobasidium sp. AG-Ba]
MTLHAFRRLFARSLPKKSSCPSNHPDDSDSVMNSVVDPMLNQSNTPVVTSLAVERRNQIWDHEGAGWKDRPRPFAAPDPNGSLAKIIAYTRKNSTDRFKDHVWVELRSKLLVDLLRPYFPQATELTGSLPGIDARHLYNRRKTLRALLKTRVPSAAFEDILQNQSFDDLETLLDFIEEEFKDVTVKLEAMFRGQTPCIQWSLMWALFSDVEYLETSDDISGRPTAFRLENWVYSVPRIKEPEFRVEGKYLQWTGRRYVYESVYREFERFEGVKTLEELHIVPLTEERKRQLTERGRVYIQADGRVMVDVLSYRRMNPNFDFWDEEDVIDDACQSSEWICFLSNDNPELHLLPPTLQGWSFAAKKWGYLLVDHLSSIPFAEDAFENLVLPEESKELIKSLVDAQATDKSGKSLMKDLVPGKGEGTVFLLHGNPGRNTLLGQSSIGIVCKSLTIFANLIGTGKTLTAEAISEYLKLPLYVVSCCEFGTETRQVERTLRSMLDLTSLWKAVVLIDEADIFLEARSSDIGRNAIVGVFLRMLEYHSGIVILTTNRVRKLDEAFKSTKILIITRGRSSGLRQGEFLSRTGATIEGSSGITGSFDFSSNDIDGMAGKELNGRVIKHIVRTSHALALQKNELVGPSHISKVWKMFERFDEDLRESPQPEVESVEPAARI